MKSLRRALIEPLLFLLISVPAVVQAQEPPHDAAEPPPYDSFIVIPLRIHVLKAPDLPQIDCKLTDADIDRIVGKVNGIWHKAGIHFGVESVVREQANSQNFFQMVFSLRSDVPLRQYRRLLPDHSRKFDGIHLYFIHQFRVNGVYMHDDFVIVKETARLRTVPNGIDEPIPRVSSHELGHALGLEHREDRTNLLASGTTGTALNAEEVATARAATERYEGSATVGKVRQRAKDAADRNDLATAHRLWTWLAQIPGDGADEAKREAESLARRLPANPRDDAGTP